MRLTLRTMLAYLDDILEPEDHQDVGRKIEESEFATSLVHKIRDVSRRMRLGAPKVAGKGMGLDPNTVAEYLDNTLTGERVPDFEKVCLESEVHLAEVACCHQILALVQVQPAEVDPDLRSRMYGIAARSHEHAPVADERVASGQKAGAAAAALAATNGGPHADAAMQPARPRPEVPDYLREKTSSRWKPIAITAALILCLIGAVLMADKTNYFSRLIFGEPKETAQNDAAKSNSTSTTESVAAGSSATASTGTSPLVATTGSGDVATATTSSVAPSNSAAGKASSTIGSGSDKATPGAGLRQSDDHAKPAIPPLPENSQTPKPAGDAHDPIPPQPPDSPRPDLATPATLPNAGDNGRPNVPVVPPDAVPVGPADGGDQRVGRLISDKEVVLRVAAGQDQWRRVGAATAFSVGDRILVLPTFRPTVTLVSGTTLQLAPETLIEFAGLDHGTPVVRLSYGRAVVMTTGKPNVKVMFALGEKAGILNFDDAEATVGVEVRPYHLPGENPEAVQPHQAITLYALSGDVSWVSGGGNPEKLHGPSRLSISEDPLLPLNEKELPKWASPEPLSGLDARATVALNESLSEKRPVSQSLLELYQKDHYVAENGLLSGAVENKSLAGRSLALIDEFEPLVRLLGDAAERAVWRIQIQSLKSALARGPAVAAKVRAAFEERSGKQGDELYRILWGFTPEELASGAASKLVEYLDNDSLELRVLSFYTLVDAVPRHPTFSYLPEQTAAGRQQAIRRFRDLVKEFNGTKSGPAARPPAVSGDPPDKPAAEEPTKGADVASPAKTPPPPPVPDSR